jgi:ubiquinone/menaquinone biosynthesis C-methylase UbiE
MNHKKFDPKKLEKLNDPRRLQFQDPAAIWQELGLEAPRVLVDIGAGTGFFARPFSEAMDQGLVYACDTSEEMLIWLKDHLPPHLKDRVVPVLMEESSVPLPDGLADLVYMINLHHELDSPELLLAEARRLLKNGGLVAVIDWKKEETGQGPPMAIRIPVEEVLSQMEAAGFREILTRGDLPYHYFVTGRQAG